MPRYQLQIAMSLRAYGLVEVEAVSYGAALEIAREQAEKRNADGDCIWDQVTSTDAENTEDLWVVSIGQLNSGLPVGVYDAENVRLTYADQPWRVIDADELKTQLDDGIVP